MIKMLKFELREVDAWVDGGNCFDCTQCATNGECKATRPCWSWNQSFHLKDVYLKDTDSEKKAMYRELHNLGIKFFKGKVLAEFDGEFWQIIDRKTKRPLFALVPCY